MILTRKKLWDEVMPLLRLTGPGTQSFLHGQTTADLLGVNNSFFIRSCWLNKTAKVRAVLEIRLIDEGAEIIVIAGDIHEVIRGFDQAIFPADKVHLEPLKKIRRVQELNTNQLARFNNVIWLLPNQLLPKKLEGSDLLTSTNLERWKMERGLALGPGELNEKNNPFELGLLDLVSLDKGCYLGQETMARLVRASQNKRQLRFWESESNLLVGQKLLKSMPNSVSKKIVGLITSSIVDSKQGGSFGLAMIRSSNFLQEENYFTEDSRSLSLKLPIGFVDVLNENNKR